MRVDDVQMYHPERLTLARRTLRLVLVLASALKPRDNGKIKTNTNRKVLRRETLPQDDNALGGRRSFTSQK
jgi:hypothetical protein